MEQHNPIIVNALVKNTFTEQLCQKRDERLEKERAEKKTKEERQR